MLHQIRKMIGKVTEPAAYIILMFPYKSLKSTATTNINSWYDIISFPRFQKIKPYKISGIYTVMITWKKCSKTQ